MDMASARIGKEEQEWFVGKKMEDLSLVRGRATIRTYCDACRRFSRIYGRTTGTECFEDRELTSVSLLPVLPFPPRRSLDITEFGVEKMVVLDGATTAEEVEKRIESLLN